MQEQAGFVKLYRKMLDWEWYDDVNTKIVFLHILLKANWKDTKYHGEIIHAGELRTTVKEISDELHISVQSVKTALNHLKSTNELTIKSTSKFSIISIKNWGAYQSDNKQANNPLTNGSPTTNNPLTNALSLYKEENKESNNKNNVKKKDSGKPLPPTPAEVQEYVNAMNYSFTAEKFYNYYEPVGWVSRGQPIGDWKKLADNWQKNEREKPKNDVREVPRNKVDDRSTINYDELERFGILTE